MVDGTGVILLVVSASGDPDAVGDGSELTEARPDREEDADAEDDIEHPVGPDDVIDGADGPVHVVEKIIHVFHSLRTDEPVGKRSVPDRVEKFVGIVKADLLSQYE